MRRSRHAGGQLAWQQRFCGRTTGVITALRLLPLPLLLGIAGIIAAAAWGGIGHPVLHGVVSAPLVTLYASQDGEVSQVSAAVGAQLPPGREILTVRARHPDQSNRDDLAARLRISQNRVAGLNTLDNELRRAADGIVAHGVNGADRQQLADIGQHLRALRVQTAQIAAEASALSRALMDEEARLAAARPQSVVSEGHAVLWSLLAADGAQVERGTPLVRIADCSRLYVALQDAALRPGVAVTVRLAGHDPLPGKVGAVAPGIPHALPAAGPPIQLDGAALQRITGDSCPIGRGVTVLPGPVRPRDS